MALLKILRATTQFFVNRYCFDVLNRCPNVLAQFRVFNPTQPALSVFTVRSYAKASKKEFDKKYNPPPMCVQRCPMKKKLGATCGGGGVKPCSRRKKKGKGKKGKKRRKKGKRKKGKRGKKRKRKAKKSKRSKKKKKKGKKGKKKRRRGQGPCDDFPFMHLVEFPHECCNDPCPDMPPRFDDCFYETSDKAKRRYQQTWVECPKMQIRPKPLCCFQKVKLPPIKRRKKKPKTACPQERKCDKGAAEKCRKIKSPGCGKARSKPDCHVVRNKADCKKVKAPYPAFSECRRPKPRPRRPIECDCLSLVSMCDVYAEMRKQARRLKKSTGKKSKK